MRKLFIICGFMLLGLAAHSQNVGINSNGALPNASAMLDIKSNNRGVLIPNVALTSATDAATISSPANSLLVYNTGGGGLSPAGFYYNSGTSGSPVWVQLLNGGSPGVAWKLAGNASTSIATDFIGTTDNVGLAFRTLNTERMRITSAGLIGIGTPTPGATVDVQASSIPSIRVGDGTGIGQLGYSTCAGCFSAFALAGDLILRNYSSPGAGHLIIDAESSTGSIKFGTGSPAALKMIITNGGTVGIGAPVPTATLSVNGTANNSTGSWGIYSDERIKVVNGDFDDGLEVISKIHPVRFNYTNDAPLYTAQEQIGVVAQELEKVAPYMVNVQAVGQFDDLREVNGQAYVFLLINAVKEQQKMIEELYVKNKQLEMKVEALSVQSDAKFSSI